jgi:DNA polymerase-1
MAKLPEVDFKAIEEKVLAHLDTPEDPHLKKAAEVFNIPVEEVTPEMRRQAKVINYTEMYSPTGRLNYPARPNTNKEG